MGLLDIFKPTEQKPAVKLSLLDSELANILGVNIRTGRARLSADLYSSVPWYYACMTKRARGIASIPIEWRNERDSVVDPPPFEMNRPLRFMLYQAELSSLGFGAAFWGLVANRSGRVFALRHLDPAAMRHEMDANGERYERTLSGGEIQTFRRNANGIFETMWEDAVIYLIPMPVPSMREIGPGTAASSVARLDGHIVNFINEFMADHFGAGAVARKIATASTIPASVEERRNIKEYLNRVLTGAAQSEIQVLSSDIQFHDLISPVKDLMLPEIQASQQMDICAAFEVPHPLISGNATNRGDEDNIKKGFYEDVLIPQVWHFAELANRVLEPLTGVRLEPMPEQLRIMQEDEGKRSLAFANYVGSGLPMWVAAKMLGLALPEGVDLQGLEQEKEARAEEMRERLRERVEPPSPAEQERQTLRRWAGKRIKQGRPLEGFSPDHLTDEEVKIILDEYGETADAEDTPFLKRTRDQWERRAAEIFARIYERQFRRTRKTVTDSDIDALMQALAQQFENEPPIVKAEVIKLFDDIANDSSRIALEEIGVTADPDLLVDTISRLTERASSTFARTMSENSYKLTLATVEDWRQTPGANKGQLIDRLTNIWEGPRPAAAATTETTRLVASSRRASWKASGVVQRYRVLTRNDDRVRPKHREIAANSPYPIDDDVHEPPFGDVNCRCTIVAVL